MSFAYVFTYHKVQSGCLDIENWSSYVTGLVNSHSIASIAGEDWQVQVPVYRYDGSGRVKLRVRIAIICHLHSALKRKDFLNQIILQINLR